MNILLKLIVWLVGLGVVAWVGYALWIAQPTAPLDTTAGNQAPAEQPAPEPIKIGFIGPLTGDGAVYGEPYRNMVALAVEEINTAGGVNGQQMQVIYEDGKCNGKDGANAAQKLVNVDRVRIILGGFCSSESLSAIPIAEAAKAVLFSTGSSSPDLTGKSHFFFRNYPSDASQGMVLAQAAIQRGYKKVAFIQEQTDYALGVYKAFSGTFEKDGRKITKEEFPSTTTDFRSILTKLKTGKPDMLFISPQTPAAAERILKQLVDLKWSSKIMINDAVAGDPKIITSYKDILEGSLTAEFGIDPLNAKFQRMIASYKNKYGNEPPYQSYAQTEYDGVYIVRDGLLAVGNDGAKFADWSRTIKDWDGASGKVTIGADGDRV